MSRKRSHILAVDDSEDNLLLLQFILEQEGYIVETANSGNLALSKIQATPPGLVLLDLMMPDINGFEVIQAIRQNSNLNSVAVVLITANNQVSRRQALKAGANDVLYKPINLDKLLTIIETQCKANAA
jgi:CheY-like chemotaxis protein